MDMVQHNELCQRNTETTTGKIKMSARGEKRGERARIMSTHRYTTDNLVGSPPCGRNHMEHQAHRKKMRSATTINVYYSAL